MKKNFLPKSIIAIVLYSAFTFLLVPQVSFAAPNVLVSFVSFLQRIITALFPIMTAAGFLAVGYNLIKFLSSKTSTDQSIYKTGIINSFVGLLVIFILFGLIKILAGTLGIASLGAPIGVADPSGSGLGRQGSFRYIIFSSTNFISSRLVPVLSASAVLFFFGNIIISMTKTDQEAERTKLNNYLVWGILAILILFTLFSIVGLFSGSLFGTAAIIPQFRTS